MNYIRTFSSIGIHDIGLVGGKNASLGQMIQYLGDQGVRIPDGFAITSAAYSYFLEYNKLEEPIAQLMKNLSTDYTVTKVQEIGSQIRSLLLNGSLPPDLRDEIITAYQELSAQYNQVDTAVAVRSSATAEDLPTASFAGQQETYLHIKGTDALLASVKKCIASLFTDRAIVYRLEKGFDYAKIKISVGVQKMIKSDQASSGVIFSLDTESGFKEVVVITSSYGLGETIVQGSVNPDEFHVFKPTLALGYKPIIKKQLGSKEYKLIAAEQSSDALQRVAVPLLEQQKFSLSDEEILELARITVAIEHYYSALNNRWTPVDIEWGKDGTDNKLYILQARPETIHAQAQEPVLIRYHLQAKQSPTVIVRGQSIGQKIATGKARLVSSIHEAHDFNAGDILVTTMTDPDWVPIMKKASAIVTNSGGRTCHAAIVSRELGIPALVGTQRATHVIQEQRAITVDCSQGAEGFVYDGIYPFTIEKIQLDTLPIPPVDLQLNIADPERAYELSFLPVAGVGLARSEFIIGNTIKIHPLAVCNPQALQNKELILQIDQLTAGYTTWKDFYVEKLAQGVATIAAAFYPKPVVVRLTDFKSNEYHNLLGGSLFEPQEENPMLGFRGAVRYCSPFYKDAFALECAALVKARTSMGCKNIKIMVPFVRTMDEAQCTIEALADHGLKRGEHELQLLMMCEVPSNVILLEEFAAFFDGFSIGSNDLAQLTLGTDRDSALLAGMFDERDPAVQKFMVQAVREAKRVDKYISICGQAPSDFPQIAELLIKNGIDALSLNPDSVIPTLLHLANRTT